MNRFSSSRENSSERYQVPRDPTNWRAPVRQLNENTTSQQGASNTKIKIAEMTKQFVDAVDLKKKEPGLLLLPSSTQLVKQVEQKRLINGEENRKMDEIAQKTLFDPKNPDRPIVVTKARLPSGHSDSLLDYKNFSDTKRKNRTSLCESSSTPGLHPLWYDSCSDQYKKSHNTRLIEEIKQIDVELQEIVDSRELFRVSHVMCANNEYFVLGLKVILFTGMASLQ